MSWFDILKEIEIDESALHAQEFAEENCCANIWKSIAQEQRGVFRFLQRTSLFNDRKTTEGCRRLVEWLREGASSYIDTTRWDFQRWDFQWENREENLDLAVNVENQKKGWLQDYVDCRNLKDGGNRPQLDMY